MKHALPIMCISFLYIFTFNVVAFVLANKLDKNFWCGYIFITLSWLCLLAIELLTASKKNIGQSIFLNAPGMFITVVHLIIQTILGIAVMVIPSFSVKVSVCIELVIFTIYLMIIVLLEIYKKKNMILMEDNQNERM